MVQEVAGALGTVSRGPAQSVAQGSPPEEGASAARGKGTVNRWVARGRVPGRGRAREGPEVARRSSAPARIDPLLLKSAVLSWEGLWALLSEPPLLIPDDEG